METFSAILALCVGNSPATGEFPSQRPLAQSLDFLFDLRLNKCLSKQWRGWWFETILRPFCRHQMICAWMSISAPEQTVQQESKHRWFETQSRSLWRHYYEQSLHHIDGLVQDPSNPSALALELLQSCTNKPLCLGNVSWAVSADPPLTNNDAIWQVCLEFAAYLKLFCRRFHCLSLASLCRRLLSWLGPCVRLSGSQHARRY